MKPLHFIRALFRFIAFLLLSVYIVVKMMLHRLLVGRDINFSLKARRHWARLVLTALGVRVQRFGKLPAVPVFFVSNHRSYLDPVVASRDVLAMPVSKSEVSKWPLIGYGAGLSGVLFVERESKMSRSKTLNIMAVMVKKGFSILLYPEGTTHKLPATINFKGGAFRIAADGQIGIVPVAIDYQDIDDAWVGDDTFIPHFFRTFGKAITEVYISYGNVLHSDDPDYLMAASKEWIDGELKARCSRSNG